MNIGYAYLELDKDWDLDDFSKLSKLYLQCYSLVYALSRITYETNNPELNRHFNGDFLKFPWRGGYSAVSFYQNLQYKIPHEHRPSIAELQYASPGYIKLKEVLKVAGLISAIVAACASSTDNIAGTYNKIQKGLSERELIKINIAEKKFKLKEADLDFVVKCKGLLASEMQIPSEMQEELVKRCSNNELMQLKILMSLNRRLKPIVNFQLEERLYVKKPESN
jgi:hypothetical protein